MENENIITSAGPLPPLPEWSKRDDLDGLVPSQIREALNEHARAAWNMGLNAGLSYKQAVVYPEDGATSPFTVINLGSGQVKIGDSVHDGRLPALWFGKDGLGMGVEEAMSCQAADGETLAVVTFANVEGLDVLVEVVQRIRRISFPDASATQPAGYIASQDLVKLGNCRAELWASPPAGDAVPVFRAPPAAMLQEFLSIIHDGDLDVGDRLQRVASRIGFYCKVPTMEEDPLDIIRTLLCAVDHYWSLPDDKRECYPSPTSEFSPLMQAARRACVERGFTAGGLAIDPAGSAA